jgi:hypothetical protein
MNLISKFVFSICIFSLSVFSVVSAQQSFTKATATKFAKFWHFTPQEKIYIHTDKPYYSAGETIWLKAYLLNAATHRNDTKSRFVYVELIDKSDSVMSRIKIRKDSCGFSGHISLKPSTQAGQYTLRAYTTWMQNAADFFFVKNINIGNSIDDRVNCEADFKQLDNGELKVELTFRNEFRSPLPGKKVSITHNWKEGRHKKMDAITSDQAKVSLNIMPDTSFTQKKYIDIEISEPDLKYSKRILIPDLSKDYDVTFFPESGIFLNNYIQTVGFKAVGMDGLSVEVEGEIYNNKDEELASFKSLHKGMGKISFVTSPNETYYAKVKADNGVEKRVQLPPTQTEGVLLKLMSNRNKIIYQIQNTSKIETSSLFLMAHVRGVVYLVLPLNELQGQIPETVLPAGVTNFSIIDSVGNTWCERLYFNRNFQSPNVAMVSDKTKYPKRSLVQMEFDVTDTKNQAFVGEFSLSVTDSKLVEYDSLAMNIENYLLLSSDLKGYIEDPGAYFVDNYALTREKTDALMLTQGWRRFNSSNFLKEKYPENKYFLEVGQVVTGRVLNAFGKPLSDRDVIMLSAYKNRINTTKTDEFGEFVMDGVEYQDSTHIILKAKSKSKIIDVVVEPDFDVFPKVTSYIGSRSNEKNAVPDDYLFFSKEKYYTDGGMMVISLDEFTVNASANKDSNENAAYVALADNIIDSEKLQSMSGMTILDVIATFPGVQVMGEVISIRGSGSNPLFVVDEIETDRIEDIMYLNASDLEAIYVFKGVSTTMFGSRGGNGVIAISLKKGVQLQSSQPSSLARLLPLGFQKPLEFYVPKYDVDSVLMSSKADLRSTVYWNPNLKTDDTGKIRVSFYTADKSNDYNIELEGLGINSEICRFKGVIRRED